MEGPGGIARPSRHCRGLRVTRHPTTLLSARWCIVLWSIAPAWRVQGIEMGEATTSIMVSSEATSVAQYLAELPEGRREGIEQVYQVIRDNIPEGYEETMNWGMISWQVPLSLEPKTYNGEPLFFCALANQKRHMAIYMMSIYCDQTKLARILAGYEEIGRKPDMGKSCIRFTKVENLPLEIIGELIAESSIEDFIESSRR